MGENKTISRQIEEIADWRAELLTETGIIFEQPIDPLTQTSGSMMTGV